MFLKLHEDKKSWTWRSNTCLVLTNILKFGFEFDDLEKVSLTFVVFEKGSKYIKQLAAKFIKTESQITYLENIQDWIRHLWHLRLFEKVEIPNCLMFHVGGWVKSHQTFLENKTNVTVIGKIIVKSISISNSINFKRFAVFYREYLLYPQVSSQQPGDLHEEEDRSG